MHAITPELLKRIVPTMPEKKRVQYAPLIQEACIEFDITDKLRVAAFLSQLAHESDHFNTLSEYASGAAYDNRRDLGNTRPESISAAKLAGTTPGRFYKGHGAIQTTGYSNHKRVGEYLGIDAVNNPKLLATPEYAFRAAGFFWKDNHVNRYADKGDIRAVSGVVNAGSPDAKKINGLSDRKTYYKRALDAIPDNFKLTESPGKSRSSLNIDQQPERNFDSLKNDAAKGVTTSDKPADETEGTPPPAPAVEIKASRPTVKSTIAAIVTFLMGPLAYFGIDTREIGRAGAEFARNNTALALKLLAAFIFIVLAVYIWNRAMERAHGRTQKLMDAAADKDKNNLRLI